MKKIIFALLLALPLIFLSPVSAQYSNPAKKEMKIPNQTVFISTEAPYYHRLGCGMLKKGKMMPMMLYDACKLYQPCPTCNPPICDQ